MSGSMSRAGANVLLLRKAVYHILTQSSPGTLMRCQEILHSLETQAKDVIEHYTKDVLEHYAKV